MSASADARHLARTMALADIAATVQSLSRKIRTHGPSDGAIPSLSTVEGAVLRHIHRFPGITPSEIGAQLHIQASNTSTALRDLEQRHLVAREVDPNDRRVVRVTVSANGIALIDQLRVASGALLDGVVPADVDVVAIAQALTAIDDALNGGPTGPSA